MRIVVAVSWPPVVVAAVAAVANADAEAANMLLKALPTRPSSPLECAAMAGHTRALCAALTLDGSAEASPLLPLEGIGTLQGQTDLSLLQFNAAAANRPRLPLVQIATGPQVDAEVDLAAEELKDLLPRFPRYPGNQTWLSRDISAEDPQKRQASFRRGNETEQLWWSEHFSQGALGLAVLMSNVDFAELQSRQHLQRLFVQAIKNAVVEEVGESLTAEDVVLMPRNGSNIVVKGAIKPSDVTQASLLQLKLSTSNTLKQRLAKEVQLVSFRAVPAGPITISDIIIASVAGEADLSIRIPLAAVLLVVCGLLSLRASRQKNMGKSKAADPEADARPGLVQFSAPEGFSPDTRLPEQMPGESRSAKQGEEPLQKVSVLGLFRLASGQDSCRICTAVAYSLAFGVALPMQYYLLHDAMAALFAPNDDGTLPPVQGLHTHRNILVRRNCFRYLVLAVILFGTKAAGFLGIETAARQQSLTLKRLLFAKVLSKSPSWHADRNAAELADQIASDVQAFQAGIGEHFTNLLRVCAIVCTSVVISIMNEPRIGLLLACSLPVTAYCVSATKEALEDSIRVQQQAYAKAGGVAGTALSMARTVLAFNGQRREIAQYEALASFAERMGERAGFITGLSWGTAKLANLCSVSLGFYMAAFVVIGHYREGCWKSGSPFNECVTGGTLLVSLFVTMRGFGATLSTLPESVAEMIAAQAAAARAFALLDSTDGEIDGCHGLEPAEVLGSVEYNDVTFAYAGGLVPAVQKFSVSLPPGSTTAFVGLSGSGKSTLLALLLRFHDPQCGAVRLDGHRLRDLRLSWLRLQIALVDQEPVLFGCSIMENILLGREGAGAADAEAAAAAAHVHDFVAALPMGYDTRVGERGSHLSGGQKQRIAIARALVRDPPVLLLDEATSALDVESEQEVQRALDTVLGGRRRTTLMVTHRLSAARSADRICVMEGGRLVQCGGHRELLAVPGPYADLVHAQATQPEAKEREEAAPLPRVQMLEPAATPRQAEELPVGRRRNGDAVPPSLPALARDAGEGGAASSLLMRLTSPPAAASNGAGAGMVQDEGRSDRFGAEEGLRAKAKASVEADKGDRKVRGPGLWQVFRMHRGASRVYCVVGLIACCCTGAVMPVFGRFIANTVNQFNTPPAKYHETLDVWVPDYYSPWIIGATGHTCTSLLLLSIFVFLTSIISQWSLTKAAERLVCRLRVTGFGAMLRQDMAWLDLRHAGSLSSQLSTDVLIVKDLTCSRLAPTVMSCAMIVVALVLMLRACWVLTVCLASLLPCGFLVAMQVRPHVGKKSRGQPQDGATGAADAASLLFEGLGNIRTVAAFGLEQKLVGRYTEILGKQNRSLWNTLTIASMAGPAASCILIACTVVLGNKLIRGNVLLPEDVMRVLMPLLWCWMGLGKGADYIHEGEQAGPAVKQMLETIERVPSIDPWAEDGLRPAQVHGELVFENVAFQYPARPGHPVLQGFDLSVQAHTTVALVGSSGNGKTTVLSLILRLYDPDAGSVSLDGVDLRALNVAWLRDQMALVPQEPALFEGAVLDNIRYGREGASEEEVVQAARLAGAHDFVSALPRGYHSEVGERGARLSGGQKQRIAIARALLRDPAVLLLDEPTSALDAHSECELQEAMETMLQTKHRTTIIVAHRLSTIQRADKICVVAGGSVIEAGTHSELSSNPGGHYHKLVEQQLRPTSLEDSR